MNTDNISMITMYTGPRGSGKTLLMTCEVTRRLKIAYLKKLLGLQADRIFTNYPVSFRFYPGYDLPPANLESEPLNMEALIVFDKELVQCQVFVDEIDQFMDRQEWMAFSQRMINKVIQLIRKRKMSFWGTIQAFEWLNNRLQWQTDRVITCKDAAFTPWGRERNLAFGEVIFLRAVDKSGRQTGTRFDDSGLVYKSTWPYGKLYWRCYNTDFEFDPLAGATKYRLKVPVREIEVGGEVSAQGGGQYPNTQRIAKGPDFYLDVMSRVREHFLLRQRKVVPTGEFWAAAEQFMPSGKLLDPAAGMRALRSMGVEKDGPTRKPFFVLAADAGAVDLGSVEQQERAEAAMQHLFDEGNHPGVRDLVSAGAE